ncbi:MAG: phosphoribosyltransferase family protein [Gammaproteobacteria bacterium]|nr:phosphoribosyltransferase family protein [Gammaproteobacteria bacterium]
MSTARIMFNTGLKVAPLTEEQKKQLELELKAEEQEHEDTKKTMQQLRVFLKKEDIEKKLDEMADTLAEAMKETPNVVVMTSLMGAAPFAEGIKNRLLKRGLCPKEDMICVSRYGDNHQGGEPQLVVKPRLDLRGRNVLILEDLIEGGVTIAYAKQVCEDLGARSVKVATLLDRVNQRVQGFEDVKPDFHCFEDSAKKGEAKWLIGRGLDEYRRARSLSWIGFKPMGQDSEQDLQSEQQASSAPANR